MGEGEDPLNLLQPLIAGQPPASLDGLLTALGRLPAFLGSFALIGGLVLMRSRPAA